MEKRVYFIFISVLIILMALPSAALALSIPGLGGSFGGRIIAVIPCTCSFSMLIIVGPPKGGSFIFRPGVSKLYANYTLLPTRWVLGNSSGTDVCLTGIPPFCVSVGRGSIIGKIGTSF